jgi:hypothetical protein
VREQQGGSWIRRRGGSDLSIEIVDPRGQPHEQIEVVVAAAPGVTGKDEASEGDASPLGPELRAERQAMAERDGLKAILDHRSHPDQADAVGDERTEITSVGVWNPDGRETVVSEQLEQMASVASIGLRLADHHRADLARLTHEHGMAHLVHEGVEPLGISRRLDADGGGRWQGTVEPFDGVPLVEELLLDDFSRAGIEDGDLLFARVQITSDQDHEFGLRRSDVVVLGLAEAISAGRPFS